MQSMINSVARGVACQVEGGGDIDEAIVRWDGESVRHGRDEMGNQFLTLYHDTADNHAAVKAEAQRQMTSAAAATLGRLGGSAKSATKSAASRANGKLGGRPKKG